MKLKVACALVLSMALGVVGSAGTLFAMTEYFVSDSTGNDAWDGKSDVHVSGDRGPKKTIQAAVDLADGTGTLITVLEGVYQAGDDLSGLKTTTTESYGVQTNLITITQPNVILKSRSGKAKTHIVGRPGSGTAGKSADSIRCIEMGRYVSALIDGFTIRDGGTAGTAGGGILGGDKAYSYVIDCDFLNNSAERGGAMRYCYAHRCRLVGNSSSNMGSAACSCGLANCLVTESSGNMALGYMDAVVNCTIAYNRKDTCVVSYGTGSDICNSLIFGHDQNGNLEKYVEKYPYKAFGTVAQDPALFVEADAHSVTNAGEVHCVSPALNDWRLLSTSPAVGCGDGAYLAKVPLPEGYVHRDLAGNLIDTNGTVNAGAFQDTMTSGAARITFDRAYEIDGMPEMGTKGRWLVPDRWPVSYRLKPTTTNGIRAYGCYAVEDDYKDDASRIFHVFHYPLYDGWIRFVPNPDVGATVTLKTQDAEGLLYVDANCGSDENDGTSPTLGDNGVGPMQTLQGMENRIEKELKKNWYLVYVAPGLYDTNSVSSGTGVGYYTARLRQENYHSGFISTVKGGAVIKGAPDPETENGRGTNAVRCAYIHTHQSFLQGFAITGSYSLDGVDSGIWRGAVRSEYVGGQVLDCVFTNNNHYTGSATCGGRVLRCRFEGNTTRWVGLVRGGRLYSCVFGENFKDPALTDHSARPIYDGEMYFCTVNASGMDAYNVSCINGACLFRNYYSSPTEETALYSLWKGELYFADAAADDYRLGVPSPAIGYMSKADYASNWNYYFCPTDVNGKDLDFSGEGVTIGAVHNEPLPVLVLDANGLAVTSGAKVGTNVVTDVAASVTVVASLAETRPFLGFEKNGEFIPSESVAYTFVPEFTADGYCRVRAVYGTNWYVDQASGNDANFGATPDKAKATINAAVTNAVSGDVVHVAEGTYAEAEGRNYLYAAGPNVFTRVIIPAGVTVEASGRKERTFIVGAPSLAPDDDYPEYQMGPGGVRCVYLNAGACIRGFTLTGGHVCSSNLPTDVKKDTDLRGGAVLASSRDAATVEDCIVSNNFARNGSVTLARSVRCQFFENTATSAASAGYLGACEGCIFDRNHSASVLRGVGTVDSCTFGTANTFLDGSKNSYMTYDSTVLRNSIIVEGRFNGVQYATNCIFLATMTNATTLVASNCRNCIFLKSAADAKLTDYVPALDSPAVDAGDAAIGGERGETDYLGNPRILNGRIDIGAVEYDWRGQFARTIWGSRADVQEVPSAAKLADDGFLLPSGAVLGQFAKDGDFVLHFAIGGTGTLRFFVNDALVGECGGQETSFALGAVRTGDSYRIAYEPGAGSDAGVRFGRATSNIGILLIVR